MRPDGHTHLYKLNQETLQALDQSKLTPDKTSNLVKDVSNEAWGAIISAKFQPSREKRVMIPRWLAGPFEPEVAYPERTQLMKFYSAFILTSPP